MLLEARGLNVQFGSEAGPVRVVSGLDFHIDQGEVFCIVGESGCGKSMTAYSVMGLLPETASVSGNIVFKGSALLSLDKRKYRELRGKEISMIFQEPMTSLNPVLKVGYQIAESLMTHYTMPKKKAMEKAVGLMRSVKIPSAEIRANEYPHQMSGGMRQRIMIAMAIACEPSLLIADEPTTALDVTIQAGILDLIRTLKDENDMSVLFITHDLGIVSEIADRVGVMYAGRFVESAPTSEILGSPRHPYTMGLINSLPSEKGKRLVPIKGTVPRPDELPPGCKFSDRCDHMIDKCMDEEPALNEISEGHMVRCIRAGEISWRS